MPGHKYCVSFTNFIIRKEKICRQRFGLFHSYMNGCSFSDATVLDGWGAVLMQVPVWRSFDDMIDGHATSSAR